MQRKPQDIEYNTYLTNSNSRKKQQAKCIQENTHLKQKKDIPSMPCLHCVRLKYSQDKIQEVHNKTINQREKPQDKKQRIKYLLKRQPARIKLVKITHLKQEENTAINDNFALRSTQISLRQRQEVREKWTTITHENSFQ